MSCQAISLHTYPRRLYPRARSNAPQFFSELSKRGNNPIYNIFPDTLATLSRLAAEASVGGGVAGAAAAAAAAAGGPPPPRPFHTDALRDAVRFLLGFINKDKHAESLAEKLLNRFESAGGARGSDGNGDSGTPGGAPDSAVPYAAAHYRDLAFCLAQLPVGNERILRALAAALPTYRSALADAETWEFFASILAKARKAVGGDRATAAAAAAAAGGSGAAKSELRELVDEWERRMLEAHSGRVEEEAVASKARAVARRARRVAAEEGIDADAIASEAAAAAVAAVAVSKAADAEAATAAKKNAAAARKAATAARKKSPAPAAARGGRGGTKKGLKKKHDDDDDDDDNGDDGEE